LSYQRGRIRKS